MFRRLLIANRGEIACRIARTCRRLGIETVAVHSDADAGALHVRIADRAVRLGPAPATASYLDIERVVAAAIGAGADAIHPGYGFLAENAAFAEACAAADITFVGPSPAAIRAMGAKDEAKRIMTAAAVPCVPGYQGQDQDAAALAAAAEEIGFPLLVKAAAGGGGKGMRVATDADSLAEALAGARGEAERAFGDGRLLLERFLERPRHIEAQILADSHGRTLFLFERECTLQRRHQKVIEEAPSPTLDAAARELLGAAAVRAAEAVDYVGAGTVEFLWADGAPWFIEMNTRLQVEHPVTEMVTGLDLVEWQLRIATGEPLPFGQHDLQLNGHAVEARLYAEDPARGFIPSTGRLHVVQWPEASAALRVDTGVAAGDVVGLDYDPMLAKLVAHGENRARAIARLDQGLAATRVVGPTTNRSYLRAVLADPAVAANHVDTGYLERVGHHPSAGLLDDAVLLAVADRLAERRERAATHAAVAGDPHAPWAEVDGFRVGAPAAQVVRLGAGDAAIDATVVRTIDADVGGTSAWSVIRDGAPTTLLIISARPPFYAIDVAGRRVEGLVVRDGDGRLVAMAAADVALRRVAAAASGADETAADGVSRAPMPGRVVEVAVHVGEVVSRGQTLLKLEAMKMEHRVTAEADGTVMMVDVSAGAQVAEGDPLVVVGEAPADHS
ncbi:MAG: biotin carboxylase N-terminal domain-containing protein [Pseudomonadota bacterium]